MSEKDEVLACTKCMWTGDYDDILLNNKCDSPCPDCGAEIEWIEDDVTYEQPFNWNKK